MTNGNRYLNLFFSKNTFFGSFNEVKKMPSSQLPEFCFIGRSNVGKSSIINAITKSKKLARISKTPGRTQSINLFEINKRLFLVDLPGYGYAKLSMIIREQLSILIQSYLDTLMVKYVGSNEKSSRDSFDKIITKNIWVKNGLPTPDYLILEQEVEYKEIVNTLGNNFIVKPIKSGSSVDIEIINSQVDYEKYIRNKKILSEYFAEQLVEGKEYTAPVICDEIFPIVQIETNRKFYDYHAKYIDENTIFTFPNFEEKDLINIQKIVKEAFFSTGCQGWGRVDFFIDNQKKIQLIEVNSIPGMTDHSLVPMSANKNKLNFIELLKQILTHP